MLPLRNPRIPPPRSRPSPPAVGRRRAVAQHLLAEPTEAAHQVRPEAAERKPEHRVAPSTSSRGCCPAKGSAALRLGGPARSRARIRSRRPTWTPSRQPIDRRHLHGIVPAWRRTDRDEGREHGVGAHRRGDRRRRRPAAIAIAMTMHRAPLLPPRLLYVGTPHVDGALSRRASEHHSSHSIIASCRLPRILLGLLLPPRRLPPRGKPRSHGRRRRATRRSSANAAAPRCSACTPSWRCPACRYKTDCCGW